MKIRLLIALLVTSAVAAAQTKDLTPAQLLRGAPHNITQPLPRFVKWMGDKGFVLARNGKTFLVDCKTGKETEYTEVKTLEAKLINEIVVRKNDLYHKTDSGETRLTHSPDTPEQNPTLSPDGKWVAFTRNNNLFSIELGSGKEVQLSTDGSSTVLNGYASWVYYEEILGRRSRYKSFWWSPDSKHIAYMRMDESKVPMFPIYSEEGQYGFIEETRYPKAGDKNPEVRVGVVPATGGATVWADFNEKDDQYFGLPYWRPDGQALWIQWMPRSQDQLVVYEMTLSGGAKKEIYTETQKTWINLDDEGSRITFLQNGKQFILESDASGWNHLYLHDITGRRINAITSGSYTVTEVLNIDEKQQQVYFTCRKDNSARYDVYRVKFNGTGLQRLTFGDFMHRNVQISPSGLYVITTAGNTSTPDRLVLLNNKGQVLRELGSAKGPAFDNTLLARTELLRVTSEDGKYELPLRIVWPVNFDKNKKYPLLINIYGGPNAGTVYDGWQLNMQQQWYAREGMIQVAMDHRGSGHFGKEGMNYLHRNLGYWEMKDWITIVKWLLENASVDPKKVAISGFSYGGYMSAYALTYGADYFTHGLAGGSVTDWHLYDTHYTERYMDTPAENPEGYKSSSVYTHIDKYKGMLRIFHGTMDDNVHVQNSLQLVRKLQEKKKQFEFMLYPGGRHGWRNLPNQDAHSANEITRFIYNYLLEKEVPKEVLR
ncbi:MAG TPA: DPP IV N-terminal domain-containing protein [Lacibacter sp.]|nr:DPP IV N-terminal domain-containing protein [Lacibacter sp.]HMO88436.1 DPP IV N-terminal domain-containing protein [Lacibacter sp.]